MVSLLGSRDELLHAIEQAFGSDLDIHVRGNEITVTGREADTDLASRLFSEMLELLKGGTQLTPTRWSGAWRCCAARATRARRRS